MHERSVEAHDLSRIIDVSHENKWVAIAPDYSRLLGVADNLGDLMRSVTQPGAIFYRVLPHDVTFAPVIAEK